MIQQELNSNNNNDKRSYIVDSQAVYMELSDIYIIAYIYSHIFHHHQDHYIDETDHQKV